MTHLQLKRAAIEIFGEPWQTKLADAIGYSPRHIRKFAAGDCPIPRIVELAVIALQITAPKRR